MKTSPCFTVATGSLLAALVSPLLAQEPPASDGWQTSAGVSLVSVPRYLGADRRLTLLFPSFDARRANGLFVSLDRGVGFELPLADNVRTNVGLAIDLDARKAKDDPRFKGLGDIRETVAARLGVDADLGDISVSTTLQSRLASRDSAGTTLAADLGYKLFSEGPTDLTIGVTAKLMDSVYARNFLSVNAAQSVASGLPVFSAAAGLQSAGLFVQGLLPLSEDWIAFARLSRGTLQSDSARSPLILRKADNVLVISASRAFTL